MDGHSQALMVACPSCKTPVKWCTEELFKPFCSQRCKLMDLGDWAMEAHKIPGQELDLYAENADQRPYIN